MRRYPKDPNRKAIRRIGNCLGTLLPAALLHELGWGEGQEVEVRVEGAGLVISRVSGRRASARPRP